MNLIKLLLKTKEIIVLKALVTRNTLSAYHLGQLNDKESLRMIVLALTSRLKKLYHLGIRSKISRSTLSGANKSRSWIIHKKLANVLIKKAINTDSNRKIFTCKDTFDYQRLNTELPESVYAVDASTIDLCLSIFSWAKFRKKRWY